VSVNPRLGRSVLYASIALLLLVAIVVATVVIPSVKADISPRATPAEAAAAFWVNTIVDCVVASILLLIAVRVRFRSPALTTCLLILGVVILLFGFALYDAARAFKHLPTTSALLVACSVATLLTAVLACVSAFLLPKRTKHENQANPG